MVVTHPFGSDLDQYKYGFHTITPVVLEAAGREGRS
jgi:hypothetical protein